MPHDKNPARSNLGEQIDGSEQQRTNVERSYQSMDANPRTDRAAGSEGIEDPALERSRRESMERGSVSRENMSGSEREEGREADTDERRRRNSRKNRRQTRESGDGSGSSFSGQGGQKGGTPSPEGTGHTEESGSHES